MSANLIEVPQVSFGPGSSSSTSPSFSPSLATHVTIERPELESSPASCVVSPQASGMHRPFSEARMRTSLLPRNESYASMSMHRPMLESADYSLQPSRCPSSLNSGISTVIDGKLYVAAFKDTRDLEAIRELGICAFLCVADSVTNVLPDFVTAEDVQSEACTFLHLRLRDDGNTRLADHIKTVFEFIDENLLAERPVVLFCQQGKSRSVSFALAYMMREYAVDVHEALAILRKTHSRADPNISFITQLQELANTAEYQQTLNPMEATMQPEPDEPEDESDRLGQWSAAGGQQSGGGGGAGSEELPSTESTSLEINLPSRVRISRRASYLAGPLADVPDMEDNANFSDSDAS